ncbi:CS domain protein [Aspergillus parasiticus SU-1]|uniref:CS domain protein n=1 Tax=Aspergillus parasiticus (strain ATCC 56775 / NRRL 5862 / SRRC 143 / SU-1) TaxID=1403190 RepID=A0A0F0ING5_ASPPU|nr:CS domain protein [Aspergillus parasiticus SU-1]
MPELSKVHPEVTWAQRSSADDAERNYLYVNIKAPDVDRKEATLKITPTNVTFAGDSKKGVRYEVSLDLYAEIDPENSKWVDEDEQDEAPEEDYANNFGGLDALGGGEGGGLGNIDFSKLGAGLEGMGGAPGLGAEGAEGESDDEEMPELEEADKDAGESAKSTKIQEVS